jgi:hypothetical protein
MRRGFGSLLLLCGLLATSLGGAQGKRGAPVRGRAKPPLTTSKESRPEARDERRRGEDDRDAGAPETSDERPPRAGAEVTLSPTRVSAVPGSSGVDAGARSSPLNPRAEEFADAGPPVTTADLERVMGDLAVLRGRIAAVSDTLFKSRIAVRLETRGDHARIAKLTVNLDDGVVYVARPAFSAEEETTVYEHAVAPGRHVIGIAVERLDVRGDLYRSVQESRFAVEAPENQRLEATIRIDDDSDIAADFPSSQKGAYDLRVRLRVRARP